MELKDDYLFIPTGDGQFISEKQRRISEIIHDYDPNLELQWIPVGQRSAQDYAFRVVDNTPGRPAYVVTLAHECDERLLSKVIHSDNHNGNVLNILDQHNAAVELYEAKKNKEERMDMHEFMHAALRSRKINWMHKGFNFGAHNGGK